MRRSKGIWLGKSERRGMMAVGVTFMALWALRFLPKSEQGLKPMEEIRKPVPAQSNWSATTTEMERYPRANRFSTVSLQPFPFNPNTISADSLLQMGLPKPVVEKWIKARSRGFVFRKPEDLQRFSILSPSFRAQLLPHVVLPNSIERIRQKWQAPPRPVVMVEINQADSLELQGLPGIGPALAHRLVSYRDRLGGFYHPQQLLEVYGIDSSLLQKILPHIQIDPQKIQTRSWNTISAEELKLFPYLTNKEAQIIVQYRKVHGPFASMEAVKKIKGIRSDIPEKLTPYLHFEL